MESAALCIASTLAENIQAPLPVVVARKASVDFRVQTEPRAKQAVVRRFFSHLTALLDGLLLKKNFDRNLEIERLDHHDSGHRRIASNLARLKVKGHYGFLAPFQLLPV